MKNKSKIFIQICGDEYENILFKILVYAAIIDVKSVYIVLRNQCILYDFL